MQVRTTLLHSIFTPFSHYFLSETSAPQKYTGRKHDSSPSSRVEWRGTGVHSNVKTFFLSPPLQNF